VFTCTVTTKQEHFYDEMFTKNKHSFA